MTSSRGNSNSLRNRAEEQWSRGKESSMISPWSMWSNGVEQQVATLFLHGPVEAMHPHCYINSEKRTLKAPLSYDKYVIFSLYCLKVGLNIVSVVIFVVFIPRA